MAGSGVTPDVQVPESNGSNPAFGVMDQDVQAAVNVAQQGGMRMNQDLSGVPGVRQPRVPQPFTQPFAQPRYVPIGR